MPLGCLFQLATLCIIPVAASCIAGNELSHYSTGCNLELSAKVFEYLGALPTSRLMQCFLNSFLFTLLESVE
jgi:hypothetical protein